MPCGRAAMNASRPRARPESPRGRNRGGDRLGGSRASGSIAAASADLLQSLGVARTLGDIGAGRNAHLLDLRGLERADDPGGRADDQRIFREVLSFRNDGAGTDDAAAADVRTVHDDRSHADQRIVLDRATMQDHVVADGAILADTERKAGIDMTGRIVLDVGALAD